MGKVSFNGPQRLIVVGYEVASLDVKTDIYTAWKNWAVQDNNAMYSPAISVIGGDPIGPGLFLGSTYFLENGWKIRSYEASHSLTIVGNLYSRDGSSLFVPTLGNHNVIINTSRSNLVDTVATGGSNTDLSELTKKLEDIEALVCAKL